LAVGAPPGRADLRGASTSSRGRAEVRRSLRVTHRRVSLADRLAPACVDLHHVAGDERCGW
jgi:hypothetical protein